MAGQTITVTCTNCQAKIKCTAEAWAKGIPCTGCDVLVRRPAASPTQEDPATAGVKTDPFSDPLGFNTQPVTPIRVTASSPAPAPRAPAPPAPHPGQGAPAADPEAQARADKAQVEIKVLKDQLKQYMDLKVAQNKKLEELSREKEKAEQDRAAIAKKAQIKVEEVKKKATSAIKEKIEKVSTQYRQQFTELQEKHQKLVDELKDARGNALTAKAEADHAKASAMETGENSKAHAELKEQLDRKAKESEILKDKYVALSTGLKKAETEKAEAGDHATALKEELEALQVQTTELRVKAEVGVDPDEHETLKEENERLKAELTEAQAAAADADTSGQDQEQIDALTAEVAKLKQQLEEAPAAGDDAAPGDMAQEMDALKQELADAEAKLAAGTDDSDTPPADAGKIEELTAANYDLQAELEKLQGELAASGGGDESEELKMAREGYASLMAEMQALQAGGDPAAFGASEIQRLDAENRFLNTKMARVREQLSEDNAIIAELRQNAVPAESGGGANPAELEGLAQERDALQAQLRQAQQENEALGAQAGAASPAPGQKNELERKTIENEILKKKVLNLTKAVEKAREGGAEPAAATDNSAEVD